MTPQIILLLLQPLTHPDGFNRRRLIAINPRSETLYGFPVMVSLPELSDIADEDIAFYNGLTLLDSERRDFETFVVKSSLSTSQTLLYVYYNV